MFRSPRLANKANMHRQCPESAEGAAGYWGFRFKARYFGLTALTTIAALTLSACGSDPETLIMSRRTGLTGSGAITSGVLRNSGDLTIITPYETFSGRWVAVREGANQSLELLQSYGNGSILRSTASILADTEAGFGTAILTSDGGRSMRCEFRYTGVQITAIGVCETTDGEVFDLQVS